MSGIEPAVMLRERLLEGVAVPVAGASEGDLRGKRFGQAVIDGCEEVGALVGSYGVAADGDDPAAQEQATEIGVRTALQELGGVAVLVVDGASLFAASAGREGLAATLQSSWDVARALANAAFLPDGRGGRIFLLAPPPDAGELADGARAGLENLARTLSIEWARYGVTVVTLALGVGTEPSAVGTLVAYLASPAGSYFSGCLLDLRGPG